MEDIATNGDEARESVVWYLLYQGGYCTIDLQLRRAIAQATTIHDEVELLTEKVKAINQQHELGKIEKALSNLSTEIKCALMGVGERTSLLKCVRDCTDCELSINRLINQSITVLTATDKRLKIEQSQSVIDEITQLHVDGDVLIHRVSDGSTESAMRVALDAVQHVRCVL